MTFFPALTAVADALLRMSGWPVYLTVGALALLESAAFLGMVLPGETAMVIAGVLAAHGNISLPVMLMVAAIAAVAGDQVGYSIGLHVGPRLRSSRLGARIPADRWARAQRSVAERGPWAVFTARFVGVLRAVVPTMAGIVGMPYRRFAVANLLGGTSWAVLAVMAGYLAGGSVTGAQDLLSRLSFIGLATLTVAGVVWLVRRRQGAAGRVRT